MLRHRMPHRRRVARQQPVAPPARTCPHHKLGIALQQVSSVGHSDCDTGLGASDKKTNCEGERRCSATQVTSCPLCNGGAMGTIRSAWEPVKNAWDPIRSGKGDKPKSGADLRNSSRWPTLEAWHPSPTCALATVRARCERGANYGYIWGPSR